MYLHGSFVTQSGETVTVYIVTGNSRADEIEIGGENSSVFFTTQPVEIKSSVNDTFDHLLRSQATIRLLTRDFIPDLFCTSCMDAVVNIYKGSKCVFAGFIEPQAYSQEYNEVFDELEISCVDVLSALQYSRYRNIGFAGVGYDSVKSAAGQRTFSSIINDILGGACSAIDLTNAGGGQYYYDGSKSLTSSSSAYGIFSQLSISELLFLGETEDDVWNQDKVLEAMLKYLNLHIVQDGLQFYIFSWESVKSDSTISWQELTTAATKSTTKDCLEFTTENAASTDTTISIGEVFNQISLTCKVEDVKKLVESPLDDSDLTSPYTSYQKYLTEYSADGEGQSAYKAFFNMCHGTDTDYSDGVITDWYLQVRDNPKWTFTDPVSSAGAIAEYCKNNANQQDLPNRMAQYPYTAIISLAKDEHKTSKLDNSPTPRLNFEDYMVVSVNGNGKDAENETFPNETSLKNRAPMAVYKGNNSGGVFSPPDDSTTNYIVLSGKIVLNPVMALTRDYKTLNTNNDIWTDTTRNDAVWHDTVPSRTNPDGRYYTQQFFMAATPNSTEVWAQNTAHGLVPFTGTGPQEYEFKYSAVGNGTGTATDTVSKVAVLACMLIIGDKCVVETGTSGQISDFSWQPYKTREQCTSDDEYYSQCFTIGFDPKIGDKLIGTEFSLQNNIDFKVGIDAEGIAIPIKRETKLSGRVQFMILGPVYSTWGETTYRHKTWFRRGKWSTNTVSLMAHVSSIFIKSFEVKIYSNNGLINNTDDSDIIYMSDTDEKFFNRKDDIEFEISSALTADERRQLGVTDSVKLSTPLDTTTGSGLLSIYDRVKQQSAKPEQLYVDSYYTEYHKPRILMTHKVQDSGSLVSLFGHYKHPAMPAKKFYIQGISRNLIEDYAELTIKEVWND